MQRTFDQEGNMARRTLTAALIVLHLLTFVHLSGLHAQEDWMISHQPVLSAQPDQPISIAADLEGRATGVLMYIMARKADQKDFRSFTMSAVGDGLFEGQIPAKWVTAEGVEYYLRLQDPTGRMLARYPEDETFISIAVSVAQPEETTAPAGEAEPEPESQPQEEEAEGEITAPPGMPPVAPMEQAEGEITAPPGMPPTAPMEQAKEIAAPVPEPEALPEEEVAETPEPEAMPEPEVAAPPHKPVVEEEPTVPPEKPEIVMEEKKGGLQTWHWLGLGALAVVGIAAVAMSGGDDGGNGGRSSTKLPDPPDHP
jgi:hypothetical protein